VPTACAGKVNEAGERLTTGGAAPVPVKLTVWVAGLALSVIVKAPLLEPAAVGVKVTLRVQLALAATLEPQVLVWEKSPLAVMLVMLRVALPVLLSVTLCALLLVPTACAGKVNEARERLTCGALPVPVSAMAIGSLSVLAFMVTAPVRVPTASGVKVTLRVQLAPAARLALHVLVSEKSPLTVMLVMLRAALPVFLSVTGCGLLHVPTACGGKVKEAGERLSEGVPTPVPVRLTVWVAGLALSVIVKVPLSEPPRVGVKVTLKVQLAPAATLAPQLLV
jgi:hypothetical protein